jgi:hypothetical protein
MERTVASFENFDQNTRHSSVRCTVAAIFGLKVKVSSKIVLIFHETPSFIACTWRSPNKKFPLGKFSAKKQKTIRKVAEFGNITVDKGALIFVASFRLKIVRLESSRGVMLSTTRGRLHQTNEHPSKYFRMRLDCENNNTFDW